MSENQNNEEMSLNEMLDSMAEGILSIKDLKPDDAESVKESINDVNLIIADLKDLLKELKAYNKPAKVPKEKTVKVAKVAKTTPQTS